MTNKTIFEEFVARQSEEKPLAIDWQAKKMVWLDFLEKFYKRVQGYLQKYIDDGQILLDYKTTRIVEEYIGEYEAKSAVLRIGKNQIRLEPIGTNLIGARGRVDMIGVNGKVKFVLVDKRSISPEIFVRERILGEELAPVPAPVEVVAWDWKIGTPPPNIQYVELTQESFFNALMEVANG